MKKNEKKSKEKVKTLIFATKISFMVLEMNMAKWMVNVK